MRQETRDMMMQMDCNLQFNVISNCIYLNTHVSILTSQN